MAGRAVKRKVLPMAMIQCPECGEQISNNARACPKGGSPIRRWGTVGIVVAIIGAMAVLAYASHVLEQNRIISGGQ